MNIRLGLSGIAVAWVLAAACGGGTSAEGESTGGATTGPGTATEGGPTEGSGSGEATGGATETGRPTETGEPTGGTAGVSDPEVEQMCNDHFTEDDLLTEALCGCAVAQMFYPDLATCIAAVDMAPDPQRNACACEVYSRYPAARDVYECYGPAREAALMCSQGVNCGPDPTALDECLGTYYLAVDETCPTIPVPALADAASECDMIEPFLCTSGEKIPGDWKCDFLANCSDMSDEIGCPGSFMCADGSQWLPDEYVCDYFADCNDGSDELGCPDYMCGSGETVPPEQVCDMNADCMDGSDEMFCPDPFIAPRPVARR